MLNGRGNTLAANPATGYPLLGGGVLFFPISGDRGVPVTQHTPDKPSGDVSGTNEQTLPIAEGPSPGFIAPVDLSRAAAVNAEAVDIAADIDNLLARSTYSKPSPVIPSICDAYVTFIHTEQCVQCGKSTARVTFRGVRRSMANGARAYVAMTPELFKLASSLPAYTRHEQTTVPHCASCISINPEESEPVAPDEFMYASKCEPLDDLRAFFTPSRQAATEQMKRETERDDI